MGKGRPGEPSPFPLEDRHAAAQSSKLQYRRITGSQADNAVSQDSVLSCLTGLLYFRFHLRTLQVNELWKVLDFLRPSVPD